MATAGIEHTNSILLIFSADVIDLSDQTGVRKYLLSNPTDYAIKHMEERDTLILVKIESESI